MPPWLSNISPSRRAESKGGYAGAYDNKLVCRIAHSLTRISEMTEQVSSTVSHLPPIPPLSPTPTGGSGPGTYPASLLSGRAVYDLNNLHPHGGPLRRPPTAASSSSAQGSVIILPDGTVLSSAGTGSNAEGRTVAETMAHSSANSPWNVLIMHVLPVFGGGSVHTSIEELKYVIFAISSVNVRSDSISGLSLSHIIASSGRVPTSRLIAVLASDLREFIGSGMLTFKAKFDNYDEVKLVARVAEQWQFFWAQVLPVSHVGQSMVGRRVASSDRVQYLEGILLPFTQIKDQAHSTSLSPIHVRNLLLTGYLIHILQPILSRLVEIIALAPSTSPSVTLHPSQLPQPASTDLQRILQMSLVLATQAKCSSFYPFRSADENRENDKQTRESVDALGKAVRWRMNAIKRKEVELGTMSPSVGPGVGVLTDEFGLPKDGNTAAPKRHSLHRGPSLSQSGRFRRRGWRASTNMSQVYGEEPAPALGTGVGGGGGGPSRQNSDYGSMYPAPEWHDSVLEEDEDDSTTPGQSYAAQFQGGGGGMDGSYATTMMSETPTTYYGTASTIRGNSVGADEWAGSQKTPQAGTFPRRRQTSGNGSRESTPGPPEVRRRETGRL